MRTSERARGLLGPLALAVGSLSLLTGCSVLRPPLDLAVLGAEATHLSDGPFFAQTAYQCGPASLAGLLGATGLEVVPEDLRPQVYLPERRGSLQVELLGAARRAGRIPYVVDSEPEAILAELREGRPVLVMQNLRTPGFPLWHYAVVVGHDPARNRFLVNTGTKERRDENARSFLRRWNWANRWGFVALVPGELPALADPLRYAEAVAAFEPVGGATGTEAAWRAALERWPDDPRPHLALGNLAHARDDRAGAIRFYREGLAHDPEHVVLANNLASVLGEIGCPRAGASVLRPLANALAEGSPWREAVSATLAELAARPGADPERCRTVARAGSGLPEAPRHHGP